MITVRTTSPTDPSRSTSRTATAVPPNARPATNAVGTARRLRTAVVMPTAASSSSTTTIAIVAPTPVSGSSPVRELPTRSPSPSTLAAAAARSIRRSGVSNTQCEAITVMTTWPETIACTATIGM